MSSTILIYTAHFGLHERPFTLLPDPDFLYWSENHLLAYSMLEYGLLTHSPITLVTGEIGAGKTTLIRQLLRKIPSDFTVGLSSNVHGSRGELLHWVLLSLGQPVESGASYVQLFTQLQKFLIDEYAAGRRTVLIFDEAQNLSIEALEELRMFSNINTEKDEVLQMVLVGQPELREKIRRPDLVQFAQRVGADYHLPSMSVEVVCNYISHRLQVAGATREIFTREACEAIHAASRGIPRVVNKICDYALAYAFGDNLATVDVTLVARVITDWRNLSHGKSGPESILLPIERPMSFNAKATAPSVIELPELESQLWYSRRRPAGDYYSQDSLETRPILESGGADQERVLDAVYPAANFQSLWIKIQNGSAVKNKAVHVILGLGSRGDRQILGIWIEPSVGTKSWLAVLDGLKKRGVKDILIAIADRTMGVPEALASVFPDTTVQIDVGHVIRGSTALVKQKDRKSIQAGLKSIFLSDKITAAQQQLEKFETQWQSTYPTIISSLRKIWPQIEAFVALPPLVRKVVCIDNVPDVLYRSLSRVIKESEPFASDQAAVQKLCSAAEHAELHWKKADNWNQVNNYLSSIFVNRLPQPP